VRTGKTPEGRLKDKLEAWCKRHNLHVVRLALMPGVRRGWPDMIILGRGGRMVWVELKAPGKTPRAIQEDRIGVLRNLGQDVAWFDDLERATAWVGERLL